MVFVPFDVNNSNGLVDISTLLVGKARLDQARLASFIQGDVMQFDESLSGEGNSSIYVMGEWSGV